MPDLYNFLTSTSRLSGGNSISASVLSQPDRVQERGNRRDQQHQDQPRYRSGFRRCHGSRQVSEGCRGKAKQVKAERRPDRKHCCPAPRPDEVIKMAGDVRKSLDKKISEEKDSRKAELVTAANQELVNQDQGP